MFGYFQTFSYYLNNNYLYNKRKVLKLNNKGLIAIIVSILIITAAFVTLILVNMPKKNNPNEFTIPLADDSNSTAESISSLVDSINDFSFNFYKEIQSNEKGNIFFSPYSIFVAFSMAYEGARGNTAIEMQNVLNFLQNDSATLGSFGRIYNLLNQNQESYTISTANAFWANKDYSFLKSYLNLLINFYMAEANELDFSKNVDAANIINSWIEEKTHNKIKDMIEENMLSDLTKLVLTNAIYFKGLWAKPFNPENTYETEFNLNSGQKIDIDMMRSDRDSSNFNYTENNDLQILKLYYNANNLSMIIILPKENNISIAESFINSNNLTNLNNDFNETEVSVQIPKFKFENKYDLINTMVNMGIRDAFSPGIADFSGMDGTYNLFIGKALHQSFIEVNEEGTEAAAATSIMMELTAMPDLKYFIADHPFIFLIQHEETGAILFMGRVVDPSE